MLLAGAAFAGTQVLYREFYSPSAFVERYLGMLSDGRAGDALAVAGVAVDSAELEAAGLPADADEALLRSAALASLTQVEVVSETTVGDTTQVTVEYSAGPYPGRTTFDIERDGPIGLAPTWRFARSPLAVVDLTVLGSMSFEVNGFEIDKRQVSPDGADADPLAAMPLLVFSPGRLLGLGRHADLGDARCRGALRQPPARDDRERPGRGDAGVRRRRSGAGRGVPVGLRDAGGAAADGLPLRVPRRGSDRLCAEVVDRLAADGVGRAGCRELEDPGGRDASRTSRSTSARSSTGRCGR